jgi:pimeloyl-ACP methyl ester carboxylesterase
MQEEPMPTFRRDGITINYEESGAGTPLLILPGWGGTIDELTPQREALSTTFRVIAADLPGSGKSGPQPRHFATTYYHDDAALFLSFLDELGASPAHLVGFSDGGEYALVMAAARPSAVKSLVTWGAAGKVPDAPEMAAAMSNLIDAPIPPMVGFAEYMKATYGEANARAMTKSFGATILAIMKAGGDISRSMAYAITCPALLITGEHDFLAAPPVVADMAAAIPNGEFLEAAGAGHPVHHERGEWLTTTICSWLSNR